MPICKIWRLQKAEVKMAKDVIIALDFPSGEIALDFLKNFKAIK